MKKLLINMLISLATIFGFQIEDMLKTASFEPVVVGGSGVSLPYNTESLGGSHSVEMKIVGNYLYMDFMLNGAGNQFRILDISDPTSPEVLGGSGITLSGEARGMDVVGNYAYIGTDFPDVIFRIIDVSNPSNPVVVGGEGLTFSNSIRSVKVVGQYAYLGIYDANGVNDQSLVILDISDPTNPVQVSPETISGLVSEVRSLDVVGKYAYLVTYWDDDLPGSESTNVLRIVDISDPYNPVVVGGSGLTLPNYARQVKVVGQYAYINFDFFGGEIDNGLAVNQLFRIVDVSDPTNPTVVGGSGLEYEDGYEPVLGFKLMDVAGGLVYTVGNSGGADTLHIIDVEDSSNPTIHKSFKIGTWADSCGPWGVAVSGNYVFIGRSSGTEFGATSVLRVVDVNPAPITNVGCQGVDISPIDILF